VGRARLSVRVVDVTQWCAPRSGGIRTYLHAKARWCAEAGASHAAVVSGTRDGVEIVAASPFVALRGRTPSRRWGYRVTLRREGVLAALDRLAPDVVVIHDALAFPVAIGRWAAARGVPVAAVCHTDLALAASGLPRAVRAPASRALDLAQRRALGRPDLVFATSRTLSARVGGMAPAGVVRLPLGIDLDVFRPARPDPGLRRRLAPGPGPLLLYAGRLSSDKRVDLLAPMLATLDRGAVLAVAGAGAAEGILRRRARRLGVLERIRMLGHVSDRAALARLMATADVFVHPNPAEPYGLAPLEALAAGCRVVAPDAAGTGETLAGRGAVLVAPGDPGALADGVRLALDAPRAIPDLTGLGWDGTFAREWACYRALVGA
jgi:alpha-1,6-mannosyltransferase